MSIVEQLEQFGKVVEQAGALIDTLRSQNKRLEQNLEYSRESQDNTLEKLKQARADVERCADEIDLLRTENRQAEQRVGEQIKLTKTYQKNWSEAEAAWGKLKLASSNQIDLLKRTASNQADTIVDLKKDIGYAENVIDAKAQEIAKRGLTISELRAKLLAEESDDIIGDEGVEKLNDLYECAERVTKYYARTARLRQGFMSQLTDCVANVQVWFEKRETRSTDGKK